MNPQLAAILKANRRGGRARGVHRPGEMNRLEQEYADMLEGARLAGEIISYEFEAVTFKIASDTRFTPDFIVFAKDRSILLCEVKGGVIQDDSLAKIKVAARMFPYFIFLFAQKKNKSEGWTWREF